MKLPEKHKKKNMLENMDNYVSLYVTPRSMWVDNNKRCYLDETRTGYDTPGGTAQLKITKVPEGYIAHVDEMKKEHLREKKDDPSFIGTALEKCYGKVVAFSIEKYCKTYNISPKTFPSFSEKIDMSEIENTSKEIIKNLNTKNMLN